MKESGLFIRQYNKPSLVLTPPTLIVSALWIDPLPIRETAGVKLLCQAGIPEKINQLHEWHHGGDRASHMDKC